MKNKIELKKTIVNEKLAPIGFIIEETNPTMGVSSIRPVQTGEIIQAGLCNRQITVRDGRIMESNNFKINSLPMCMLQNGQFVDIPNDMEVVGRVVQDNKNIGYEIVMMNDTLRRRLPTNIIMQLSYWFKPSNFSVRTNDKGNSFLYGANGTKIDALPIVNNAEVTAKRTRPSTVKHENAAPVIQSGFDIIYIMDVLKAIDGSIIRFPGDKYNATGAKVALDSTGFNDDGIGEIASAHLDFNPKKLNVNAGFKKLGYVPIRMGNSTMPVQTFEYRTKHIFSAGSSHLNTLGIVIDSAKEQMLRSKINDSLLTPIEKSDATGRFSKVISAQNGELQFYSIDLRNVDLISKERMSKSLLSAKQLEALCKLQYEQRVLLKVFRSGTGFITKTLKKQLKDELSKMSNKKIFGPYQMFSVEGLKACEAAGIDVTTGAYTNGVETKQVDNKSGASSAEIEIEYILSTMNVDKFTGADICKAVQSGDTSKMSEKTFAMIKAVLDIMDSDPMKAYELALKTASYADSELEKINRRFWEHIATMYITGNKTVVHSHDKGDWERVATKATKKEKFACKSVEGLTLTIAGINMAK